jgi:hypothetical protein
LVQLLGRSQRGRNRASSCASAIWKAKRARTRRAEPASAICARHAHLGYIEGRDYVMEERYAAGQMDRFTTYAQNWLMCRSM